MAATPEWWGAGSWPPRADAVNAAGGGTTPADPWPAALLPPLVSKGEEAHVMQRPEPPGAAARGCDTSRSVWGGTEPAGHTRSARSHT